MDLLKTVMELRKVRGDAPLQDDQIPADILAMIKDPSNAKL